MAKKKTHGGKRKSAGRKPVDDKKVAVTIYIHQSVIDELGIEIVKDKCYEALS